MVWSFLFTLLSRSTCIYDETIIEKILQFFSIVYNINIIHHYRFIPFEFRVSFSTRVMSKENDHCIFSSFVLYFRVFFSSSVLFKSSFRPPRNTLNIFLVLSLLNSDFFFLLLLCGQKNLSIV